MQAQPERIGRMEREAVYRIRELFAQTDRVVLRAEQGLDEPFIRRLSEWALYPEKPLLSFSKEGGDGLPGDTYEFFRAAGQLKDKPDVRKFITCGGVDDGKSTLIGRILYETKSGSERAEIAQNAAYLRKDGSIDYALLAGMADEEAHQGITVCTSYSIFEWKGSSFLMADVPGHEEYTHHMAAAAFGADAGIIMLAANKGIVPQTRRHTRICYFMGIRSLIFAVNKMDMASFSQTVFLQLAEEIRQMMEEYPDCGFGIVPVAAKSGANIAKASKELAWHRGGPLLDALGQMKGRQAGSGSLFFMPVQRTCKSSQIKGHEVKRRVIQGEVSSGMLRAGDEIFIYPTGKRAKVTAIYYLDRQTDMACEGDPVGIELDRDLDAGRGSVLTKEDVLAATDCIEADLLWTSDNRLTQGRRYRAQIGTAVATAAVTKICYRQDVNTGEHNYAEYLTKNALARCEICFPKQMAAIREQEGRVLGTVVLTERDTHLPAAYGNIVHTISGEAWKTDGREVTAAERENALGQKAGLVLFAKSEGAREVLNYAERYLLRMGFHTVSAMPEEWDERELDGIRRCLGAGLIVLAWADAAQKERVAGLPGGPGRVFDCMEAAERLEEMGSVLKRMKQWASELV